MTEKVVKVPQLDELKVLLRDKNHLVWYSRCPSLEGPKDSLSYLKKEIKKFKKEKKKQESLQD